MLKTRIGKNKDITYNKFLSHTKYDSFGITTYSNNEYLVHEGDKTDCLLFVISGRIKIFRNYENGKTMLLRIFDDFTVIGDIEYILEREVQCTVQVMGEVKVIKVPFTYLDVEYRKDINFLNNILIQLSSKILLTNDQAALNLMYSLDTRLASYLLSFKRENSSFVDMPSLVDVSNNLGTSYRHLSRTIKKFIEKGAIMKINKKIKIKDMKLLLEISQGNVYEDEAENNFWG